VNGGPGMPSSGTIGGSHTYADDGTYTVTVTVHDDNGGVSSSSFTVLVSNANPVVSAPHGNQLFGRRNGPRLLTLARSPILGSIIRFNPNAANPPSIADPLHESFTYDINWAMAGRDTGASIADVNGGPGVPSTGTISGSHTYADDGDYTVTITVHDDNGGVASTSFTVHVTTRTQSF